jgi:hypothetical protein
MRQFANTHALTTIHVVDQSMYTNLLRLPKLILFGNTERLLRVSRNLSARADLPAALLSLHTTPKTNLLVQDELPNHLHPAVVARQIAVELVRDLVQFPQPGPRHSGKVVMLVVQADVVREQVQHAVIGEGLWRRRKLDFLALFVCLLEGARVLREYVVFGDEVACNRVKRASEERAQDEVAQRFAANVLDKEVVDHELHDDVEGVDAGEGKVVNHHGTQGVEEDLESREERFAGNGVEEPGFEGGGKVSVETIHAERLVVGQVVRLNLDVSPTFKFSTSRYLNIP